MIVAFTLHQKLLYYLPSIRLGLQVAGTTTTGSSTVLLWLMLVVGLCCCCFVAAGLEKRFDLGIWTMVDGPVRARNVDERDIQDFELHLDLNDTVT